MKKQLSIEVRNRCLVLEENGTSNTTIRKSLTPMWELLKIYFTTMLEDLDFADDIY